MQITDSILEKYAKLIVEKGACVQKGQKVLITIPVEHHAFAALLTEAAYRVGAAKVDIDWEFEKQSILHYRYAEEEVLSTVLPWELEKMKQLQEDLPCRIRILSSDPDALAGLDMEKLSNVMQKRSMAAKPFNDAMSGKYQWVVAGIPNAAWAQKCFPDLSEEEAVSRLWDGILNTVRITPENDPESEWNEHTRFLQNKSEWLNAQKFKQLHYRSANGTDFTVELNPLASWQSAGETCPTNDVFYIPNLPTEEVFTSPYMGRCEGTLVSTKPLSWNGRLIENFALDFKDGRVVSFRADKGEDALEYLVKMDEGASMLGEVALVPIESPVNRCGFLFYNTLFDENACCHFALGRGFRFLLENGTDLSVEETKAMGLNDSVLHVDFMVGSEDLEITGIHEDGSTVTIFRNGTWAI